MKKIIVYALGLFAALSPAFGLDYGAILRGSYLAEDTDDTLGGDSKTNRFIATLAPWVSLPLGKADFNASAGMHLDYADYREKDKMLYVPELLRFEVSGKPQDEMFVKAGRISWQDPSRLVAKGRFDGADVALDLGKIRLGIAGLYTGLQYYDTAEINISPTDPKAHYYASEFDWDDFGNTYFAPRRMLACLYGEFPGLPFDRGRLYGGLIAQFDLSGSDERFHTQYLTLRHTLSYNSFDLTLAGVGELEKTKADGRRAAFAASAEAGYQLPSDMKPEKRCGTMRRCGGL